MINKLLLDLCACPEAKEWAKNKSWQEIFNTCEKGEWLLWLFARTNPGNLKEITLVKAHIANTVRHLMQDDRSKNAVDVAIRFGNGEATKEELDAVAYEAYVAYAAANVANAVANVAAYVAYAAANAVANVANVASYVAANAVAYAESQKLTADICRKYLTIEIWNIKDEEVTI